MRNGHWWIYITQSTVYWSQWIRGDSLPVKSGTCEDPLDVPAPPGANIIVCLAGENIRTFQVDMPAKNRQKFLKSIAYTLEDKLLHGPEDYHFVRIVKEHDSGRIVVAVMAKKMFDRILEKISEKHWQINLMTADYLYIPEPEANQWILDVTGSPLLLRGNYPDSGSALAGEITASLHPALRLVLEKSSFPPKKLQIRVSDETQTEKIRGWQATLSDLGIQIEIVTDGKSRIDWLSGFPDPGMDVNFLTGQYKTAINKKNPLSRYIPATAMAFIVVLLLLVQVILDKNRVEKEYDYLRAEQEATYRELFPQARNLVDPRFQMEQALARMQASAAQDQSVAMEFLSQMETLSRYIEPGTGNIQSIEFDGTKFIFEINIQNYELLEDLQQRLGSEMKVTVEKAELQGQQVQSRIALEARS